SLLPALLPTPDVHITDAGVEAALTAAVRIINPLLDVLWQTDPPHPPVDPGVGVHLGPGLGAGHVSRVEDPADAVIAEFEAER
ncbi:hypothetical protein C6A85_12715, partial [Mycobacterium sp. ITM-2017-0098]